MMPRLLLTAFVPILLALAAAPGQSAGGGPDYRNAATYYARAIANWQQFRQSSPQQAELIGNFAGDPTAPITPEIRAALLNVQGIIADMRRGSQQERCDFSLDYSQGFELLLPHLGEMRGIARAMRADAAIRLNDGDSAGAAQQLSAMFRMSGHCGDDRVLISSLVGQAVFAFGDVTLQRGLDTAAFSAGDAAALLAATGQLGTSDPFQYLNSVAMEHEIALATFEKYRGPEGIRKLASMLGDGGAAVEALADLDDAGFDQALGQYDQMMTRVNTIFAMTDKDAATAEMATLLGELEKGEYGPLAMVIAPAFGKVLEQKFKAEEMVAKRIETLSALASGAQKPEEAANAALWYLRAIDMWEALPAEKRAALLAHRIDVSAATPAPIIALLEESQPIIDVFREASIKRRCDFTVFVPVQGVLPIAPHYSPGMHELLIVLRADAARLLAAGDLPGGVDRLATAVRGVGHLSGDVHLLSCRAAHVNFIHTLDLVEAARDAGRIDVQSAPELADSAARLGRKDPFGYLAALQRSREPLIRARAIQLPVTDEIRAEFARQSDVIRQFNGDQVLFILILMDELNRRGNDKGPPPGANDWQPHVITLPETIERLTEVIDAGAARAIREQYPHLGERFERGDRDLFIENPPPPAARLAESLARARGDLRRATRLLMLREEADGEDKPPGE